ncbi:BON domain-containing protein [Pseudoalteromonas 'SMAR']|uniref:BON domain-containing protein n=1 Tax=Pseudoalteromonas 'SMAR' TaxID=3416908 RepID=UPI003AF2FFC7
MKKTVIASLFLTSLSATSAMAADNNWEAEAADAWIDGKAEATLLFNGELNNFDINTDVRDGTVILTGEVDRSVDKKLAEELVLGIDGVKEVDNELTVVKMTEKHNDDRMEQASGEFTDMKIATVINSRYLFDTDIDSTGIDVEVEQGNVTLTGHVESEAERKLAVQIAENANDVAEVENHLEISDNMERYSDS